MTDVQAILSEIKGKRSIPQWAEALGLSRQAVWLWFNDDQPLTPGWTGLLAIERDATPQQYARLLAVIREHKAGQATATVAGD